MHRGTWILHHSWHPARSVELQWWDESAVAAISQRPGELYISERVQPPMHKRARLQYVKRRGDTTRAMRAGHSVRQRSILSQPVHREHKWSLLVFMGRPTVQ